MSTLLRLALVVVGLASVVYGVAALTGGWLETPPWWEESVVAETSDQDGVALAHFRGFSVGHEARKGRGWIAGGVAVVGLGMAGLGASSGRRRPRTTV